jgi:predicted nucleic-acid-binding protein
VKVKSLDTNVLARFFSDDPDGVTLLLAFEWVMRGFYDLPRGEVGRVLSALAGIEHVTLEDRAIVLTAIDRHADGMDFADALHLGRGARSTAFVTFDRRLAQQAGGLADSVSVELLQ